MQQTKQTNAKVATFLTRSKTALYIVGYYAIILTFALLSDKTWFGNYLSNDLQFAFAILLIVSILPIIFITSKELGRLFFSNNKWKILIIFAIISIFYFIITLTYTINRLHPLFTNRQAIEFLVIFFTTFMFGAIVLISLGCWLWCRYDDYSKIRKNDLYFPILMFLCLVFFISIPYLLLLRTWTTVLILLLISNLSDVFAYIGGVLFGKHKMCPKISPKKSWEGAIISFVVTTLVMMGVYALLYLGNDTYHSISYFFGYQFRSVAPAVETNWWWYFILALLTMLLIVISMFGDLAFSFIKRRYGIKDFGNILPGHGGILDRIDALSFVFGFYFIFTFILNIGFNFPAVF